MNNRSLDDFLGGDDAQTDESDATDESDTTDEVGVADAETESEVDAVVDVDSATRDETDDDAPDSESVAPARPTFRWSPTGAACDDCGETVERRWVADLASDERRFVCEDCKSWD